MHSFLRQELSVNSELESNEYALLERRMNGLHQEYYVDE